MRVKKTSDSVSPFCQSCGRELPFHDDYCKETEKAKKTSWEKDILGLQLRTLQANWKAGEAVFRVRDLVNYASQVRQEAIRETLEAVMKSGVETHIFLPDEFKKKEGLNG